MMMVQSIVCSLIVSHAIPFRLEEVHVARLYWLSTGENGAGCTVFAQHHRIFGQDCGQGSLLSVVLWPSASRDA